MRGEQRMNVSRSPTDRLRFFVVGTCYCLSAGVLILQLLSFYGSQFVYALFFVLQALAFWFVVSTAVRSSPLGRGLLLALGALAVGAIPFRSAFMAVAALVGGGDYHFSSFTRDMPTIIRVMYEVGFFPSLQFALMFVASRFWPTVRERAVGADITS